MWASRHTAWYTFTHKVKQQRDSVRVPSSSRITHRTRLRDRGGDTSVRVPPTPCPQWVGRRRAMVHAGRAVSINLARCCPDIYCSAVSYAAAVEGKGEQATLAADDSDEDGGCGQRAPRRVLGCIKAHAWLGAPGGQGLSSTSTAYSLPVSIPRTYRFSSNVECAFCDTLVSARYTTYPVSVL